MFIEKNDQFLSRKILSDRNGEIGDNLEAVKQQKYAKRSKKINKLCKKQNKFEEKCLKHSFSKLSKENVKINRKLDSQLNRMRNTLEEINAKTSYYLKQSDEALTPEAFSPKNNSFIIESNPFELKLPAISKSAINGLFVKQNQLNDSYCYNCMFENSLDLSQKITLPRISSCNFFPFSLPQPYTSIVGEKNDRIVTKFSDFHEIGFEEKQIQVKNYRENKSIQRTFRKKNRLKDLELRIEGVEAQADFIKTLNKRHKKADRNIRYGDNNF